MIDLLKGRKTYICSSLLVVMGIVDILGGDTHTGVQKIIEGFTAMSVRNAIN